MAGKVARSNTFEPYGKLQYRWEAKYPDLQCCMVDDYERYTGERQSAAMKAIRMRQEMGYRVIPMTDAERLEMMDSTFTLLMGVEKSRAPKASGLNQPDDTTEEIF